jgi:hypothetical protein
MRFRKLRIAWSVFWGLACILLIVLWVRSYFVYDTAYCPLSSPQMLIANSYSGRLSMYAGRRVENHTGIFPQGWGRESASVKEIAESSLERPHPYWAYRKDVYGRLITFPHWAAILVLCSIGGAGAVLPLTRFSVRSLLVAITLVAVVLGLAVWAAS